MKTVLSMATIGALTSLMAGYSATQYIYKDARIMGMGGANTAVGGYASSVFYNPAGISNIKKSHGLEVELLGLQVEASETFNDIYNDYQTINDNAGPDGPTTKDIQDLIDKYSGEHVHEGITNFTSFSHNGEWIAWSLGILAGQEFNLIPHSNSGSNGFFETYARGYGLVQLSGSKSFDNVGPGTLDVGLGIKYLYSQSVEGKLTISELLDNQDDLGQYLQDTYLKGPYSGIGFDLGVNYKLFPQNFLHPQFSFSLLNIGALEFEDKAYGSQPMTMNIGASISPEVPYVEHLIVSIDYKDLTNANYARFYDENNKPEDVADEDVLKRLAMGVSVGAVDNSWVMLTLNGGLYQGAYTAGLDAQITVIKLSAATYQEELGTGSITIPDRRYMAQIGIGW